MVARVARVDGAFVGEWAMWGVTWRFRGFRARGGVHVGRKSLAPATTDAANTSGPELKTEVHRLGAAAFLEPPWQGRSSATAI